MKQLRVLTGLHAGARLKLRRASSTLGSGSDVDIQITDWKRQPVELSWDEQQDLVALSYPASDGEGGSTLRRVVLQDFQPRRVGYVVLCVGPADDALWPADIQLLSRMLKPRQAAAKQPRAGSRLQPGAGAVRQHSAARRILRIVATVGTLSCTVMVAGFTMLMAHSGNSVVAKGVPTPPLSTRVAGLLARESFFELSTLEVGRKVVVEGLVDDTSALARARALLLPLDGGQLVHRYAAASDIAQSISDALGQPGLYASYSGQRVFVVRGSTTDVARLQADAKRIAMDIGPLVKRIDVSVAELPPPQRAHIDSMLVSEDLRYVQTRDGTKHLIVSSPAAPLASTAGGVPLH